MRELVGQGIGVVSTAAWLGMVVYFMSQAAVEGSTNSGNYFVGFAAFTVLYIAIMIYWKRFFDVD